MLREGMWLAIFKIYSVPSGVKKLDNLIRLNIEKAQEFVYDNDLHLKYDKTKY